MSGSISPERLKGRRAVVTGAGGGVGRSAALRLAAEGAAVAVLDKRRGASADVAAEITQAGGRAISFELDVSDEAAVKAAVARTAEEFGGLDTAVACAGIAPFKATTELSLPEWEEIMRINATGVFLPIREALPHLLASGDGAIVTVGSVGSLVAAGGSSAYDASKGAVLQFTRAVAVEYAAEGVRANCVCPGRVDTELEANTNAVSEFAQERNRLPAGLRIQRPIPRGASPDEIASVIAFLCSAEASFMTGAAIPVDGGHTAI